MNWVDGTLKILNGSAWPYAQKTSVLSLMAMDSGLRSLSINISKTCLLMYGFANNLSRFKAHHICVMVSSELFLGLPDVWGGRLVMARA